MLLSLRFISLKRVVLLLLFIDARSGLIKLKNT